MFSFLKFGNPKKSLPEKSTFIKTLPTKYINNIKNGKLPQRSHTKLKIYGCVIFVLNF